VCLAIGWLRAILAAMPESSRCAQFRAWSGAGCQALSDSELELALQAYLAAGRAAWPSIPLADADFLQFLAERSSGSGLPDAAHASDVWLACGCARGLPEAREAFYTLYAPVVTRVLARRGADDAALHDAKQVVFERLLVGDQAERARIADYKGTGPLKSWVSTVAATTLLMMRRSGARRREQTEDDDAVVAQAIDDGPELQYLKLRYKAPVEAAIVTALAQLGDRDRVLLRLHLSERMSIDRLAAMYNVNRATAARWLVAAREALFRRSCDEIRRTLGLNESECGSILNLVNSQLEISVARHLQS
jgi:RNA polymerase sigma-70 factor (ECF subfamily)